MTISLKLNILVILVATGLTVACRDDSTSTSPTTTTSIASPTTTENFNGTLAVSGSNFYSFSVSVNGTVNVTLVSVSGAQVPSTVMLGLAIGTPSGQTCASSSSIVTQAGSSAQLTGTYAPGLYCAMVYDVGNLFGPADFAITIAHP